jgi:phage internal scaffolding protein
MEKLSQKKITEIKNKQGKVLRRRVQTFNLDPSMTDQSQEQESNVNFIMQKYQNTGISPDWRTNGFFADLTNVPDLSTALQTVTQAQQAFDQLPSNIRERMGNSPEFMMEYLLNPANKQEAISLGLVNAPEPTPEPLSVRVIPEPEPKK